jgi:outer membrane lipase/esterase
VEGNAAKANPDVTIFSAAATVGYDWIASEWEFSSYGRVDYTDTTIDGYTDAGTPGSNLIVEKQNNINSLETALGARVGRVINLKKGVIVLAFELEWVYLHEDDPTSVSAAFEEVLDQPFGIVGSEMESDYFNASLSISATYAEGFSAFLGVDTLFG